MAPPREDHYSSTRADNYYSRRDTREDYNNNRGRREEEYPHYHNDKRSEYSHRKSDYDKRVDYSRTSKYDNRYHTPRRFPQEERYAHNDHHQRSRSRSPSTSHSSSTFKKRSDSPDYTGPVESLRGREKILQNWDLAPPGFERIRADVAKSTGLFPPPGNITKMANYVPPTLDPARVALLATLSAEGTVGVSGPLVREPRAHNQNNLVDNRISRRVKISGYLAAGFVPSIDALKEYFNNFVRKSKTNYDPTAAVSSVASVYFGADNQFALVEFYSIEDTQTVLNNHHFLDGVKLTVERPNDDFSLNWDLEQCSVEQLVLFNIPLDLSEKHARALLTPFGQLLTFVFLKSRDGKSLGTVVFEMDEPIINDLVLQGMNGQLLGTLPLRVMKVAECKSERDIWKLLSAFDLLPVVSSCSASPVLQLFNLLPSNASSL